VDSDAKGRNADTTTYPARSMIQRKIIGNKCTTENNKPGSEVHIDMNPGRNHVHTSKNLAMRSNNSNQNMHIIGIKWARGKHPGMAVPGPDR
jgi:hypothetical protein